MYPRIYTSFTDFERSELRKLDSMGTTVDDLLEERLRSESIDIETLVPKRKRGRPRKNS